MDDPELVSFLQGFLEGFAEAHGWAAIVEQHVYLPVSTSVLDAQHPNVRNLGQEPIPSVVEAVVVNLVETEDRGIKGW